MAAPTFPLISVEEYLNTSYEPDMEYVDGVLVERNVGTPKHSLLQAILLDHFRRYRGQFKFAVLPEARTELVQRSRYRIPDILLCALPIPAGKVIDTVPMAVIEILSPDDRMITVLARFREYSQRGVTQIVLMDPEYLMGYRFSEGALTQTSFQHLELASGQHVPFNSDELFAQFTREIDES